MTPTKFLIGQMFVVFFIVVLASWTGTQYAAHELGFQNALGPVWFNVGGTQVYVPWRLYQWWIAYEGYAPDVFFQAGLIAAAGGLLSIVVAIIGSLWRARQAKTVTTYGSSRWATVKDISQAGLFCDKGLVLGQKKGRYIRHDGPEHVMCFAPTRSGKGVGLVIPTLLSWTGSALIHDIKGENWQLTAGWRGTFSHVILFNPTDSNSSKFNPLMGVRKGRHEVRDVQHILIPQDSRLIGKYDSEIMEGQGRILVIWQRIIMPNGASILIDNLPAADTEGYAGLSDKTDYHTSRLFKVAALSTLLNVGTELAFNNTGSDLARAFERGTQDTIGRTGQKIVDRNLNIKPTNIIRPGWSVRVLVSKDIILRPYGA
ncbi:TrbI/VirB10 family protein [Paremcibacter congregatus]|uniref:Conjugal transfer protein TraG n=1 Tax=Paremcibacter congregatus TaxID=2043170 RepID=A0A2G4YS17_9PROT|nr:TrbI/VirB10 family protein [Paremcibacter congregatus]PHZ85111.1 hypothetical protein CRD36_08500 [Paremcibacter congregatus]QDE27641.1 hypothetical protein FIV45_10300 [Paremcibacter congregatus]